MRKEVIAHKDPKSPISEVFRTLRTNIQFMSNSKKMKSLLVTSTFPGEGKSWITSNLAVTFAQAGKRVIIIDADMRKGREYSLFGVSPRPGLSNLLSEWDYETDSVADIYNYVQETEVENLFVITAGNVPPNPSELLVSKKMKRVLEGLKQVCDLIIIDGTPCELVTDSVILSRIVDTTIIVTAHKKTKKDALQRVARNIKNVGGNVAGVIINKVPISSKKYGEKYYYYGHDSGFTTSGKPNRKDIARMNSEFNQRRVFDTLQRDKMPKELLIEKEEASKVKENVQKKPYNEQRNNQARQGEIRKNFKDDSQKRTERSERPNYNYGEKKQENQQRNFDNQNVDRRPNNQNFEEKEESQKPNTTANGNSMDKTNDILKQINDYLENEKKNLN